MTPQQENALREILPVGDNSEIKRQTAVSDKTVDDISPQRTGSTAKTVTLMIHTDSLKVYAIGMLNRRL